MLVLALQFLFWFISAIGFAYWLVETYARPDTQLSVKLTVMVCWVISFTVPFLQPCDFYGHDRDAMVTGWTIVYVSTALQCWAFVPLLQNYFNNGGFSYKDRVKQAILIEVKFYLIVGVIAASLVGVMLVQGTFTLDELPGLLLVLANTWGLGLLTIVLGYGVVAVPRYLWSQSDSDLHDKNNYLVLANISEEACGEQDRLQQTNAFVDRLISERGGEYVDTIRSVLLPSNAYEFAGVYPGTPMEDFPKLRKLEARFDTNGNLSHSELMRLHHFAIEHRRAYRLAYSDWNDAVHSINFNDKLKKLKEQFPTSKSLPIDSVPTPSPTTYAPFPGSWIWVVQYGVNNSHRQVDLEDDSSLDAVAETSTLDSANNNNKGNITRKVFLYPLDPGTVYTRLNALWFKFLLYHRDVVMRVLSILAGLLSLFTLYSEMTIMIPMNVSIMTLVDRDSGLFFILITTLPLLLYITMCSFYTLFRFRLFSFYHMHKRQRTGEASILHNAAFTLRLVMPLGYNYFRILQDKDTAFTKVHGAMDSIPLLGGAYNTYMPALVVVVAILSFVGPKLKIFKWLGFVTYEDDAYHLEEGIDLYGREMNFRSNGVYEDNRQVERRQRRQQRQLKATKYNRKEANEVDEECKPPGLTPTNSAIRTSARSTSNVRDVSTARSTSNVRDISTARNTSNVRDTRDTSTARNSKTNSHATTTHTPAPPRRSNNASNWDAKNTFKLENF